MKKRFAASAMILAMSAATVLSPLTDMGMLTGIRWWSFLKKAMRA